MNTYTATDPRAWLVLYNADNADSRTWVDAYRDARGVPHANLLGLRNVTTDETIDEATWLAISDVVRSYIGRNRMTQTRGILLGHNLPAIVDTGQQRFAISSLLASLSITNTHANNPHYVPGLVTSGDLPMRSSLCSASRYLVGEITGPTLADAIAMTTRAEAFSTVAADGMVISNLMASRDTLHAPDSSNDWPALDAWRQTAERERNCLRPDDDSQPRGQAICLTSQAAQDLDEADELRALFVSASASAAAAVRDGESSLRVAIEAGYAFALASVGAHQGESCPNPAALFAALRSGGTWAEATALALPTIASSWRAIGDPLWGMPLPRAGFGVYRGDDMSLLAVAPDVDSPNASLANRMPPGDWPLLIRASNAFGCLSQALQRDVYASPGGSVMPAMRSVTGARAVAAANGMIELHWSLQPPEFGRAMPERFEIALTDSDDQIIKVVAADEATSVYKASLGPFAHGRSVSLVVRAARDAQLPPQPWCAARGVIARSVGPAAPQIVA